MDYNTILQQIKQTYTNILHDNLVGIYVHGSIAFDCFTWDKSDIDYIVVVNHPLTIDVKRNLIKETLRINEVAPQKGLEMSVVLKEHCVNFCYPTPFDLHYSNTHKAWFERDPQEYCEKMKGVDKDLAAHFTVTKAVGIVLCGEPIDSVFGEVPKVDYLDSIKYDIEGAKDEIDTNPVYIILNLCRVLAHKRDGLVLSKKQGGTWGIEELPGEYQGIIKASLTRYTSDEALAIDIGKAHEFCEYMLSRIYE